MRFLHTLVALCALSSVPLRADTFDITFNVLFGGLTASGTFTTNGICGFCTPGSGLSQGLLSLTINIGPDSGASAFDISDDGIGPKIYNRPANTLLYMGSNSETNDFLDMALNDWFLTRAGSSIGSGTYSITPAAAIPEPSYLFLLMPIVALVGLHWRHQRHPG